MGRVSRLSSLCYGKIILQRGDLRAIFCESCGYAHLSPRPSQKELDRLYKDEYYQSYHAGWFDKEAHEFWYWRRVYQQRLRQIERLIDVNPEWHCYLLDYGAGCGWFVQANNKEIGWSVFGCEPNAYARDYAKHHTTASIVSDCSDRLIGGYADLTSIHTSLVLEHLLDPLDFLKRAYDSLLPGGVLCIVVPNEFNPLQFELMRRFDYTPLHEHHINYFSLASLRRLVEQAGFEVAHLSTTFPIEWFALHGLNYTRHPRAGLLAHWLRMALEATALSIAPGRWEARKSAWAARGIGREIELYARRPRE